MKKITHTFSILSTSIIGLALSATLVTANDYLSRADAQRYQIHQATQKATEENEEYYKSLKEHNFQLLLEIRNRAALTAEKADKGEEPLFDGTKKVYLDLREYMDFRDRLKSKANTDKGVSKDFYKLIEYVDKNFDCLYDLYEKKDFTKLRSFMTPTAFFGDSYVPGGNGCYLINIVSLPSTQQ